MYICVCECVCAYVSVPNGCVHTLSSFSLAALAAILKIPSVSIHFSLRAIEQSCITVETGWPIISRCCSSGSPYTGWLLV